MYWVMSSFVWAYLHAVYRYLYLANCTEVYRVYLFFLPTYLNSCSVKYFHSHLCSRALVTNNL